MGISLKAYMDEMAAWISSQMLSFLPEEIPPTLYESMKYSLQAGGKRIRPILLLSTIEALGKPRELGLETASAIEMIHTYSLIHDDLPAMDNDDFRRGKPTNHKVFGEGIAILAGDALLTWAFYLISSQRRSSLSADIILQLIRELAIAAGPIGMVGGQVLDLEGERKQLTLDELERIHRHKTGDLIHYSVYAGAIIAGADDAQKAALSKYARNLGLAFQIQDDILDIVGNEESIGKPIGSDQRLGKSTYPALMGLEQAKMKVYSLVEEAKEALNVQGIEKERLAELADFFVNRQF
jgi:geranylgeranyl diphosphate synthase type II